MIRTLILTDNRYALSVASELQHRHPGVDVYQSSNGALKDIPRLIVKEHVGFILDNYDLVVSIHCKQFFPKELVSSLRCINVHPGYNPENRGWFPHVFSILNGKKAGVTIHEMDEYLDHGPIIVQEEYIIQSWDTSATIYQKLLEIERTLLLAFFDRILQNDYVAELPSEGNVNYLKDYNALKELELDHVGTLGEHIDKLRALTHPPYQNAYFYDQDGQKVFIRVELTKE